MSTQEIMSKYIAGETTLEETNEALRAAGAGYFLQPLTEEERAEKNAREDAAGYIPAAEAPNPLPKKPDMRRRVELIGLAEWERELVQHTVIGDFRVKYDEQGYALRATKI